MNQMDIFVKDALNTTMHISINPEDTLKEVMDNIIDSQANKALSFNLVYNQSIIYSAFELSQTDNELNNRTVYEANIYPGSTLYLIPTLPGGSTMTMGLANLYKFFYASKSVLKQIYDFYPPWAGASYWFVPCAINVFGIYHVHKANFTSNKENANASAFISEPEE